MIVVLALASLAGACPGPRVGPDLVGVAATDNGLVAVGGQDTKDTGIVLVSTDGRTWTRSEAPQGDGHLRDVVFGNGTIVTINGSGQLAVKKTDGAWQHPSLVGFRDTLLFGNGVFFALAGGYQSVSPAVSTDGLTWSTGGELPLGKFFFDGVHFLAFNDMTDLRTSVDGLTWSNPPEEGPLGVFLLYAVATVGDQLLGFGFYSAVGLVQLLGPRGSPLSSLEETFLDWRDEADSRAFFAPTAIATDGARVVVISFNGVRATTLPVGSTAWSETDVHVRGWQLWDVSYGAGLFAAVGRTRSGDRWRPLIVTSSDGVEWTEASLP